MGQGGGDFARRSGKWLQSRHSYSMQSRTPDGDGDVLIRWIASTEPGHCELFAGSMVVLARAAGVPARLVTGFKGGVWNETSGNISVKNSDAHAWAEVWEEGLGAWLRVDATPGAQLTPPGELESHNIDATFQMERDSGWSARMDGLRIFWYRQIVSFDQTSQLELMRETKDKMRTAMGAVREAVEKKLRLIAAWVREPWDFSRVAGIALLVGTVAGGIVLWKRFGSVWWLAWRSQRAASHRHDPVRREASRWLARLERAQGGNGEWVPGTASSRAQVTTARQALLRLRYGAREGWPEPGAVFRLARQARRAMRREA